MTGTGKGEQGSGAAAWLGAGGGVGSWKPLPEPLTPEQPRPGAPRAAKARQPPSSDTNVRHRQKVETAPVSIVGGGGQPCGPSTPGHPRREGQEA